MTTRAVRWMLVGAIVAACAESEDLNVVVTDGGQLPDGSAGASGAAGGSADGGSDASAGGAGGAAGSSTGGSAGSAGAAGSGGSGGDAGTDAPVDALPDAMPVTGLGLHHKFDSTTGDEFDFAGNNNTGAVTGGVQRGLPGKIGFAFDFSSDGRVQTKSSPTLDMISAGTIEFWIKVSSLTAGAIVSRGTGSGDNSVRIKTAQGNVQVVFTRVGGGSTSVTSDPDVLGNQWKHVAVVNNGSQLLLYVNGAVQGSAPGGQLGSIFADVYVGKNAGSENAFNGSIDDLRWWSVARTAQEVCQDAGGTPTTVDGAAACTLP